MSFGMKKAIKKVLIGVLVIGLLVSAKIQGAELKEEIIEIGNGIKLEMVLIPAGKFIMGSIEPKKDPFSNEVPKNKPNENEFPAHEVTLTKQFYMGKYEVTQEQWYEIMGYNPSADKGKKLPVTNVSFYDCKKFIIKLNEKTNLGFRLPTEARWEYACRAGTTTAYSFGDSIGNRREGGAGEAPVGTYKNWAKVKANAFGLYDMHGNVREWCYDFFGKYPTGPVTDPIGPDEGREHVLRGGSDSDYDNDLRSARRMDCDPKYRDYRIGFRLVRVP
jgi:formylglycine-generating enzyme required for sulfatase activity